MSGMHLQLLVLGLPKFGKGHNRLKGSLPDALWVPALRLIMLASNDLQGTLPDAMRSAEHLQ
eukprot:334741-Amphidinium_carterae.1